MFMFHQDTILQRPADFMIASSLKKYTDALRLVRLENIREQLTTLKVKKGKSSLLDQYRAE